VLTRWTPPPASLWQTAWGRQRCRVGPQQLACERRQRGREGDARHLPRLQVQQTSARKAGGGERRGERGEEQIRSHVNTSTARPAVVTVLLLFGVVCAWRSGELWRE
jgi:hypothetical protein